MTALKKRQDELANALIDEYPTAGALTLAKRLYRDHPEYFTSVEMARQYIRYRKGTYGVRNRRIMANLNRVKDLDKVLADRFALPEPSVMKRDPYIIPKFNDKQLIFGDTHFPFQNNFAIYEAIEYGIKKSVNCIVLNGDMVDLYQDSRYTKDGRKPNLEYELDMFYQFLIDLKATFPNALIIWKFGNHEERYDTYWKNNAPLHYAMGTEALDDYIPCRELGIVVVKDKRRIESGNLVILHGHEYGSGAGNVNPARAMSLKSHSNMLVNHFHRSSMHKVSDFGIVTRYFSLGSMCMPQDYSPYGQQDNSFGYLRVVDGVTYVENREI